MKAITSKNYLILSVLFAIPSILFFVIWIVLMNQNNIGYKSFFPFTLTGFDFVFFCLSLSAFSAIGLFLSFNIRDASYKKIVPYLTGINIVGMFLCFWLMG